MHLAAFQTYALEQKVVKLIVLIFQLQNRKLSNGFEKNSVAKLKRKSFFAEVGKKFER